MHAEGGTTALLPDHGPRSTADLLQEAAAAAPQRAALVCGNERIEYADLAGRAERLAGGLAARGLGPGDPIALTLGNTPAFVTSFFAIAALGGIAVPLNPQFEETELEFYLREAGVRAVIADPKRTSVSLRIASRLDRTIDVISTGRPGRRVPALDSLLDGPALDAAAAGTDDDAVYQYSSGSTGRPKRAPRTHAQLLAEADSLVATLGLREDDTILCAIPLHHTYGLGCCLTAAVRSRATLVLDESRPVTLRRMRILKLLENEGVTVFPSVPYILRLLAESSTTVDLERLRLCFSAAAALPRSTFDGFRNKFGVAARQLYGCTEAGAVSANLDEDPDATAASVGRPIEDVDVRIVDEAGNQLEPGRIGEIAISSPAMTRGYTRHDEQTRLAFRDGYFFTGDRGRLDEEGRLFITGRKKLLIDVRGDKVDPVEVEDVLATHPKVREVVVVGAKGSVEGEELVKAVVVPDGACEGRELIRFCRERLVRYKVPELVEFRDEIPKSATGKILRKYLVE
jgi:long-chain acyl-CoA synthetase